MQGAAVLDPERRRRRPVARYRVAAALDDMIRSIASGVVESLLKWREELGK